MEFHDTEEPDREGAGWHGFWRHGRVWFRELLPQGVPWGDETLLDPIPGNAVGSYGVKVGADTRVDGELYRGGQVVVVDSESDFRRLLPAAGSATDLIFPWYERMVPTALVMPHRKTIDLAGYRRGIEAKLLRTVLFTAGLVAIAFAVPDLMFIALIAAVIYGLHPLVELVMAWMRRVDLLTVEELNRRSVNFEFFRRWILTRPSRWLKAGLGVLVAVFAGQVFAGTFPSITAAALVRERVLEDGEWWRVVTTGLMHGNVIHILFNGMALYSLGRVLVALVSPAFLSFVFLFTVVTGSLSSLWLGPGVPSVGASGGILGCLGFLLVVTLKFKKELPGYLRANLVQATIVVAVFGALGNKFIDNAAHAGGLLGGIALGLLAYPWMRLAPGSTRPVFRVLSGVSIVILLGGVVKIVAVLVTLDAP
jgi:membrane associated rhomboid family serine protease